MKKSLLAFFFAALLASTSSAASVTFSTSRSNPSPEAVADGAPDGGQVLDFFVTTDVDIISIGQVLIDVPAGPLFQVPPPWGSDTSPQHPEFIALMPAVEVDSWITTPGRTSLLGSGLDMTDGTSTFGDFSNDGAQTDFHFARLTVPPCGGLSFIGRVSVAGSTGPEYFPFSLSSGSTQPPPLPSVPQGSTIDLTEAYRNNQGAAPNAIEFFASRCSSVALFSATVLNPSTEDLFEVSINGRQIDLNVNTDVGGRLPAGTRATGNLVIETSAGPVSYSLVARIPEPTSLVLASFGMMYWILKGRLRSARI